MNCPSCSAPMLFGATSCACGYGLATAPPDDSPVEISYWEGLRAYWRIYWPAQLLAFALTVAANRALFAYVNYRRELDPLTPPLPLPLWVYVLGSQLAINALALFLFVPRIVSRPYRGFSLVVVNAADGGCSRRLSWRQHSELWFFLWWRQIAAALFSALLAVPLSMILWMVGIRISTQIGVLAGLFAIGPILLKMLIGHPFRDFRIEARRTPPAENGTPESDPTTAATSSPGDL